MNRRLIIFGVLLLMTASFLVGTWISYRATVRSSSAGGRKILHYVDPMHPAYTSDKPGIAPDCGMPLEPVYADGAGSGTALKPAALPPGTVQIAPDRQQLIGVRVAPAEVTPAMKTVRFAGRVAADETRTYIINATIDGWITRVSKVTTGSIVKHEEVLASFYSPDFLSATSALLFALGSMDRVQAMGGDSPQGQVQKDQMAQFNISLQQYKDALRNLGMGRRQIDEIITSRKYSENIDITSPGYGVILARNVSDGQRFVKGEQFFKIGDLRRVWVLIDVYQNEADALRPGMKVNISLPQRQRTFTGEVSPVPPIFDPGSRTLKVRLYVANPDMVLRPDMFVDVELPVTLPKMLAVPVEAVLDSGLKKTVFVEKSAGIFEPREVVTGRTAGNLVEIRSGLKAGERIAVSGTFLLDSESKMKSAASGISGTPRLDPVCGMYVDEEKCRAKGLFITAGDTTSFFCSDECRQKFTASRSPQKGAVAPAKDRTPAASGEHTDHAMPAHGMDKKHD